MQQTQTSSDVSMGMGSGSCGAPECQRTAETVGQRPYIKGWRSRPEKGNQGGGDPRVSNLSNTALCSL